MAENEVPEDSAPTPAVFELEQTDAYSKYLLYSKSEILAILRVLIQKGSMITAYFDQGRSFMLTSVIAIAADNHSFILDMGSNDAMNRKALLADHLIFTTQVDKVKIQFSLNSLTQTQHEGRLAFLARIPETMLRLQRREFFRLATPVAKPITLHTTSRLSDDTEPQTLVLPLVDISGGGVGLLVTPEQVPYTPRGALLPDCKMELPDEGVLVATLCVRNQIEVTARNGAHHFRVGCEFVNLSAARASLVQRYITRVERDRRARLSGN
jgi:c-di-GMP-binding flagellar brake protein YcgR